MFKDELDGMTVFVAVAEAASLREAGERLRVTGQAVSQALRQLEERLGVPLVQRTTRSLRLTEAGERLYAGVRPALDEVRAVVADVGTLGTEPRGTVRLHVSVGADVFLGGSVLAGFAAAHPHVRLDVTVSDAEVDIVAAGYDAGVQLGEVIDRDMVAVPVSGDIRLAVVGSPDYFARRGQPTHPRDLMEHDCIGWKPAPDAPAYRWEFTENGREFSVAVPTRVLTDDVGLNIRLARAGTGITMAYADHVRDDVAQGALVSVLDAFHTPFPGYYLYYPQRRHASPPLRAFVDYLRGARRPASGRKPGGARPAGRSTRPRGR